MSEDKKYHEYDGIIEHDNPLPTWWLWTFFLTIIFAFLYFLHYEIAGGPTLKDELKVSLGEIEKMKGSSTAAAPVESEDSLAGEFKKPGFTETGASAYAAKCAACHGHEMQGLIGPNLVDKFWIHGKGTRLDIVKVIREGVADKGMPPWGPVLKKEELYSLAAYIISKKGSNPPGAKPAEGEPVEDYLERK